jgi:hypothetical protein
MGSTDRGWIWITNGTIVTKGWSDKMPPGFYPGRGNWRKQPTKPPKHDLEIVHRAMMDRCYNSKNKEYHRYGGRVSPEQPIRVCMRWHNKINFIVDVEQEIGPRPEGRTPSGKRPMYVFDRADNDGNYEPGNIQWSTYEESGYNREVSLRIGLETRTRIKQMLLDKNNTYSMIATVCGVSAGFVSNFAQQLGLKRQQNPKNPAVKHTQQIYERVRELLLDPKNTHEAIKKQIKQETGATVNVGKLAKEYQIQRFQRWTREHVIDALIKSHGKLADAAKLLGCSVDHLGRGILKRLGINKNDYKRYHRHYVNRTFVGLIYE